MELKISTRGFDQGLKPISSSLWTLSTLRSTSTKSHVFPDKSMICLGCFNPSVELAAGCLSDPVSWSLSLLLPTSYDVLLPAGT